MHVIVHMYITDVVHVYNYCGVVLVVTISCCTQCQKVCQKFSYHARHYAGKVIMQHLCQTESNYAKSGIIYASMATLILI